MKSKISELENSNQKLKITLQKDLSNIIKENSKSSYQVFFSNFEKLYPHFKENLNKVSKHLTANELKLSAFLKLNLSSKEIASLLNIAPESVDKARYRLRKKLNLSNDDDLSLFMINV